MISATPIIIASFIASESSREASYNRKPVERIVRSRRTSEGTA